jgi:hypothetical protein
MNIEFKARINNIEKMKYFLKIRVSNIDAKNKLIVAEIHNEVDLTLHEFVDSNPEICLYKVKLFLITKGHTPLFLSISNVLKEEEYIEEYLNEFMYGW